MIYTHRKEACVLSELYCKKYSYGNTLFSIVLCDEDDARLLEFFENNVKEVINSKEEMYRWLISHDIYFFVRYLRKDRFVINHLLSLYDFKRNLFINMEKNSLTLSAKLKMGLMDLMDFMGIFRH